MGLVEGNSPAHKLINGLHRFIEAHNEGADKPIIVFPLPGVESQILKIEADKREKIWGGFGEWPLIKL